MPKPRQLTKPGRSGPIAVPARFVQARRGIGKHMTSLWLDGRVRDTESATIPDARFDADGAVLEGPPPATCFSFRGAG